MILDIQFHHCMHIDYIIIVVGYMHKDNSENERLPIQVCTMQYGSRGQAPTRDVPCAFQVSSPLCGNLPNRRYEWRYLTYLSIFRRHHIIKVLYQHVTIV